MIWKVCPEKARANHVDDVTKRRANTAADKDEKIVHRLSLISISPRAQSCFRFPPEEVRVLLPRRTAAPHPNCFAIRPLPMAEVTVSMQRHLANERAAA